MIQKHSQTMQKPQTHQTQEYVITKKIAKQGKNSIIVIPSFLKEMLRPQTIVELKIKIIERSAR